MYTTVVIFDRQSEPYPGFLSGREVNLFLMHQYLFICILLSFYESEKIFDEGGQNSLPLDMAL